MNRQMNAYIDRQTTTNRVGAKDRCHPCADAVAMEGLEERLQMAVAADLVVSSIRVNGFTSLTVDRGGQYTVSFRVRNQGNAPAWVNHSAIVLSNDRATTSADRRLGTQTTWLLLPGRSEYRTAKVTVPADTFAGQRLWLGVIADADGWVLERNERNNNQGAPAALTVRPPRATAGTTGYHDGAGKYVVYGTSLRLEGSRAWRNNNPGNIEFGPFAQSQGAIGNDGRFAVFPDEQTGMNALLALLRGSGYRELTLNDSMYRYAPPGENDTGGYVGVIRKRTGLNPDRRMGSLSNVELRAMANVIKQVEGWKVGQTYRASDRSAPQWAKQLLGT